MANNTTAFVPELWANESILILEENMVFANLVYRDFDDEIASFGDIVNTRKPQQFVSKRKTSTDNVTTQDAVATNVQVALNQHNHVSFIIPDEDGSKSFQELTRVYLEPAMIAQARFVDQAVSARAVDFLGNTAGGLGRLSSATANDFLVDSRTVMNNNNAPLVGRNMVFSADGEAEMLKSGLFAAANTNADGGAAQRDGLLGRKSNFTTYMDQNVSSISGQTTTTTAVATAALAGATTVTLAAAVGVGTYISIVGDYTPLQSTNNLTATTLTRALKSPVAVAAVVNKYPVGAVDLTAGYAAGWVKEIVVDGLTGGAPQVGQIISFNNGDGTTGTVRGYEYMILDVTAVGGGEYQLVLDRPLETALADDDLAALGPDGQFNLGFHKNAIALVNRPLALPASGTGALSAVAEHNGTAMRVVMAYDALAGGMRVTVDGLFGTKTLDSDLGCVLLG